MKTRIALVTIVASLSLTMTVLGLSATLTDVTDPLDATFRMKYGSNLAVEIGAEAFDPNAVITPGSNVAFDPYIENCGNYDTYVFIQVKTPDDSFKTFEISNDWTKIDDNIYAYGTNGVLEELPAMTKNADGGFTHFSTDPLCTGISLSEDTAYEQGDVTISAIGYAIDAEEVKSTDAVKVWKLLQASVM